MIGELPVSLEIAGEERDIRTDYRDILNILIAVTDPDLRENEKVTVSLTIFYKDIDFLNEDVMEEAIEKMNYFIDCGEVENDCGSRPRLFDWEQDEQTIFAAVNKVAGHEVRAEKYLHWWTFLSYFQEIGDGTFATIVSIRDKKARGKRLDASERDFYKNNSARIDLKKKYSEEQQKEMERLNALLD